MKTILKKILSLFRKKRSDTITITRDFTDNPLSMDAGMVIHLKPDDEIVSLVIKKKEEMRI